MTNTERQTLIRDIARELVRRLELAPLEEKVPHLSVVKVPRDGSFATRDDPFDAYPEGDCAIGAAFLNAKSGPFTGKFTFVLRRGPVHHGEWTICDDRKSVLWRFTIAVNGELLDDKSTMNVSVQVEELRWDETRFDYDATVVGCWDKSFESSDSGVRVIFPRDFSELEPFLVYPIPGREADYYAYEEGVPQASWVVAKDSKPPIHEFSLAATKRGDIATVVLINGGVRFEALVPKSRRSKKSEGVWKRYRAVNFCPLYNRSDTWSAGVLLEATCTVTYGSVTKRGNELLRARELRTSDLLWPKDVALGIGGLYEAVSRESTNPNVCSVEVRDVADAKVCEEYSYEVASMDESLSDSLDALARTFLNASGDGVDFSYYGIFVEALKSALDHVIPPSVDGVPKLRKFQYEAADRYARLLANCGLRARENEPSALVLKATTASGKTLAFLLPTLFAVALRRAAGKLGTTAILVYPTRALAVDQAKTIIKILWHLNATLTERGLPPVRIGILAGETPSLKWGDIESEVGYRFRHPENDRPFKVRVLLVEPSGGKFTYEYSYDDEEGGVLSEADKSRLENLLSVVRDEIYANPPDILITTPDTINLRLMDLPESHSILGREVKVCPYCLAIYSNLKKRKCSGCGRNLNEDATKSYYPPEVVVIDEVHQLRGSFGAQVSYVFSRFERAVREYAIRNGRGDAYAPLYVLSSATFRSARSGVRRLLRVPIDKLREGVNFFEVEPELDPSSRVLSKVHVFVKPKVYSEVATLARILETLRLLWLDRFRREGPKNPKTIVFVNSIGEVNLLLSTLNDRLSEYKIEGHSTDYHVERSKIEERFSRCETDMLVATSGLEVGVDFDEVEVVVIFGAPNYLADYRQRIGRAGRSERKRPALVIHVFKGKPTDYLYKRHFEITYIEDKLEEFMRKEEVPFAIENTVVRKRSIERALFDFLATRGDSSKLFGDALADSRRNDRPKRVTVSSPYRGERDPNREEGELRPLDKFVYSDGRLSTELLEYISDATELERGSPARFEEVETTVVDLLSRLSSDDRGVCLAEVSHPGQPFRNLSSLRESDEAVDIEFSTHVIGNKYRSRGLGIFMGKYYEKGIYSYMGVNLIVDNVTSRPANIAQPTGPVDLSEVPRPALPAEPPEDVVDEFRRRYLFAFGGGEEGVEEGGPE